MMSKLNGQAPYLPWAKIKGTYYYWDAKAGPDIKGNILGVDIEITPSVSFELGQENNNTMDATSYGNSLSNCRWVISKKSPTLKLPTKSLKPAVRWT